MQLIASLRGKRRRLWRGCPRRDLHQVGMFPGFVTRFRAAVAAMPWVLEGGLSFPASSVAVTYQLNLPRSGMVLIKAACVP